MTKATSNTAAKPAKKPTTRRTAAAKPAAKIAAAAVTTPVAEAAPIIEEIAIASEQLDRVNEFVRKSAATSMEHSQSFLDQLNNAANKASVTFDEATNQSKKAAEDLNLCAIEAVKSYSEMTFSFAKALTSAGSIGEVVTVYGEHTRQQFEHISKAGNDLQEAFGTFVRESAKPFSISAGVPLLD